MQENRICQVSRQNLNNRTVSIYLNCIDFTGCRHYNDTTPPGKDSRYDTSYDHRCSCCPR